MNGAVAPIHFAMGGEGVLHGGGEPAAGFRLSGPRCWAQRKRKTGQRT
jgi:hypothetical protein